MILIATDGLCKNNQGSGGQQGSWAFAVFQNGKLLGHKKGTNPSTTNNEMEAQAILEALKWLHKAGKPKAEILMDSKYCLDSLTKWYKNWENNGWINSQGKPVANKEIFQESLGLLYPEVSLEWVKGHSGNRYNEAADMFCNEAYFQEFM